MTTSQPRVTRGIPAGGQFAPEVRSEPTVTLSDPDVLANLNRPSVQMALTEEQASALRRHRTPVKDAMNRRGVQEIRVDLTATANHIRTIQDRLNGR